MKHISILLIAIFHIYAVGAQTTNLKKVLKEFRSSESKNILVVAHRGAHTSASENSMQGFKNAVNNGVDIVELDVRHTKDSVLVLMHDKSVDRTTNGSGLVESFTLNELKKLRLKHDGKVTNEAIPTLEEALSYVKGKILVNIDIKTPLAWDVVKMVKKMDLGENVYFLNYLPQYAMELKKIDSTLMVLQRTNGEPMVDAVLKDIQPRAIHIDDSHNEAALNAKIKKSGARVFINSLGKTDKAVEMNDFSGINLLIEKGVNMIQTDHPELLLKYLREKGLHW